MENHRAMSLFCLLTIAFTQSKSDRSSKQTFGRF